jgi:hypothetical protein
VKTRAEAGIRQESAFRDLEQVNPIASQGKRENKPGIIADQVDPNPLMRAAVDQFKKNAISGCSSAS